MDRFPTRKILKPLPVKLLVATLLCLLCIDAMAARTVNIISWWGYLFEELLEPVQQQCGVAISVDEYTTNPEFLRRSKKSHYDIAIYSDTVYPTFISRTPTAEVDIQSGLVDGYHTAIRNYYRQSGYKPNTVFFQFALTGFLWNPKVIQITSSDTIEAIFAKAGRNTLLMLDEHIEVLNLLSKLETRDGRFPPLTSPASSQNISIERITALFGDSHVVISSNLGEIFKKEDFAFAFTWSGEAIEKLSTGSFPHRFLVHTELSHWSKDVLTVISPAKEVQCVARALAGEAYLSALVARSYYFSPFRRNDTDMHPVYRQLAREFYQQFDALQSLPRISEAQYEALDYEWQSIKMVVSAGARRHAKD